MNGHLRIELIPMQAHNKGQCPLNFMTESQIKTTLRCKYTLIKMAQIQNTALKATGTVTYCQ